MDDGTFRNTPTVHPMERRIKLREADANNASICNPDGHEIEVRRLLNLTTNDGDEERRQPLRVRVRQLNRSKRQLKGAAERKLRTVKKAWGTFKSVSILLTSITAQYNIAIGKVFILTLFARP